MKTPYNHIHIIINPAAGKDEAILNTLNRVFNRFTQDWSISITRQSSDATRFAKEAINKGADLVAGYGGDGTQMEVANGLIGSDVPLAIFPGGTGNAMAHELRVPLNLEQAAELVCKSKHLRSIDMAQINGTYFMLRAYTGVEPDQRASREMKDQYGNLAYIGDTLRMLSHPPHASYQLTIDGQEIEEQGMTCLILNAGSLGGVDLRLTKEIDISDGLLDVFIVNSDVKSITALASFSLEIGSSKANLHRWQGREIIIDADSPQSIWIDGEFFGPTPQTIAAVPSAIRVVVPEIFHK